MFVLLQLDECASQVGGGALPVPAVLPRAADVASPDGPCEAAPVEAGEGQQMPQASGHAGIVLGCACTDIRYRARAFDERVSVCMDCGRVWKVWPKVVRHG
ncbi:hypothetical protein [Luteitalea sp.]|uniref:hypothetical protein n=1 Tax=Luteitalea sp. TaxID=2004800 RepID=UPI0025BCE523|nr:hypothetical protein [Luteitalea sp.]